MYYKRNKLIFILRTHLTISFNQLGQHEDTAASNEVVNNIEPYVWVSTRPAGRSGHRLRHAFCITSDQEPLGLRPGCTVLAEHVLC